MDSVDPQFQTYITRNTSAYPSIYRLRLKILVEDSQ